MQIKAYKVPEKCRIYADHWDYLSINAVLIACSNYYKIYDERCQKEFSFDNFCEWCRKHQTDKYGENYVGVSPSVVYGIAYKLYEGIVSNSSSDMLSALKVDIIQNHTQCNSEKAFNDGLINIMEQYYNFVKNN